jgi:hypothetical protein
MSKKSNPMAPNLVFIIVLMLFLGLSGLAFYFHYFGIFKTATLADYMGVANTLLSAMAFAGVLYTIAKQSSEFREQMQTQYVARFEETFFKILERHELKRAGLKYLFDANGNEGDFKGVDAILHFLSFLNRSASYQTNENKEVYSVVNKHFSDFRDFGDYFQGLYDIHMYVINHKHLNREEKEFYLRILKHNMNGIELTVYYYYAVVIKKYRLDANTPDIFDSMTSDYIQKEYLEWYKSK